MTGPQREIDKLLGDVRATRKAERSSVYWTVVAFFLPIGLLLWGAIVIAVIEEFRGDILFNLFVPVATTLLWMASTLLAKIGYRNDV